MMASTAWYYGWWLLSPGYKIIVRAPQIIWGVLIKTWHFQGYFTPWTAGAGLAWLLGLAPTDCSCFIWSCAFCHCEQDKNIGMKECSRLWEIPGILLRHINTHLRILSIVKKPNRGLEPINLELMNLSLTAPTGYHLGTTCSWPIASRCRFAIEFLQTFLSSLCQPQVCTRIHKHRHLSCLGTGKL